MGYISDCIWPKQFSDEHKERHRIYCYLVMSLLAHYWNPWKRGVDGKYNWIGNFSATPSTYLGHNIACFAVDGNGKIIDFDFNHNEIFNSSIEHAEARLLRRLFSLTTHFHSSNIFALPRIPDDESSLINKVLNAGADIVEEWEGNYRKSQSHYGKALKDVTIYTSLESCAQCSGMMALGAVKEVVFLQQDPGQKNIGNILFNLNNGSAFSAPEPISANTIDLAEFQGLDGAFDSFVKNVNARPFYEDGNKKDTSPSITSFLCTNEALEIFKGGRKKLKSLQLQHKQWKPNQSSDVLTNEDVLKHVRSYHNRAIAVGRRATPQSR